jgi:hypothetical protein
MFGVAEKIAPIDVPAFDLPSLNLYQCGSYKMGLLPINPVSPEVLARAKLEMANEDRKCEAAWERQRPLLQKGCQATRLVTLGILAADAGFGAIGRALVSRGEEMWGRDMRDRLASELRSEGTCSMTNAGGRLIAHLGMSGIEYDREPTTTTDGATTSGLWPDYSAPRSWLRIAQGHQEMPCATPTGPATCSLPVDLLRDRAFVGWQDFIAELTARAQTANTAIELAAAASKLAIADGMFLGQ